MLNYIFIYLLKLFRRSKQMFSRLWNFSEGQNKCFRVSETFQKVKTNVFTSLKLFRRSKQMFSRLWNFSEGQNKCFRVSETFQKDEINVFMSLKLFRRSKQMFSCLWNFSEAWKRHFLRFDDSRKLSRRHRKRTSRLLLQAAGKFLYFGTSKIRTDGNSRPILP